MKKWFVLLLISFTFLNFNSFGQRGKNGAKTISTNNTIVNEYTALTANATTGATSITVTSNTLNANGRFSSSLAQGDLIFIIQIQGASLITGWSAWNGWINSIGNAGLYEFAEVLSVSGSTTINLECGLTNNYTAAGKVEVVRVPRYSSLTINVSDTLTCDIWSGTIGGVLAVETNSAMVNNGCINATGKGSRGGTYSADCDSIFAALDYASTNTKYGGHKGEGIAGYGSTDGQYCRACAGNGGGGGNAHNCGGGGGSNTCNSWGYNGCGFPDTTTSLTYIQAWDLELATDIPLGFVGGTVFHKNASNGGGRGGYSFSANNSDALTVAPGNTAWGGDNRRDYGGFGGFPLNANEGGLPRLFMGGGGGGGSQNDGFGGVGGTGGGIIYLMTYGSVSGTGTINSNGNPGGNSAGTAPVSAHAGVDGCGGGGGGGAIVLNTTGTNTGNASQAKGGSGGNQLKSKGALAATNFEAEGPGGGGGGGYIAVSSGAITRIATGGNNGTSTSSSGTTDLGVSEFPPNGATKGGPGVDNATVTNFTITAPDVSTCIGISATLTATLSGTIPSGITYGWYDAQFGGTLLSNGLTLTISNPTTTTTYYFRACPGTYAVPVVLNVNPSLPITLTATPSSICNGQSSVITASGATTYSWMPGSLSGTSNTVTPVTTTVYTVTGTSPGCTGSNTVTVTVNQNPVLTPTANPTTICNGASSSLSVTSTVGGTTYSWMPGSLSGSPVSVTPGTTTTYTITGTASSCTGSNTVTITVNPNPVLTPTATVATICNGASSSLSVTSTVGGTTYSWMPGSLSGSPVSVTPGTTTTYTVTGTASSCTGSNTVTVTVNPNPVLSPTATLATICNGASSSLSVMSTVTGTTYSWMPGSLSGSPVSVTPGTTTTYTVTGTASSCTGSNTVNVTVNPNPVLTPTATLATICNGATSSLSVTSTVVGSTYSWMPGSLSGSPVSVTPGTTTTYTVTGTASSCTGSNTVTVIVNPIPTVSVPANIIVCNNGLVSGTNFISSPVGGTFAWTNSNTTIGLGSNGLGNIPGFTAINTTAIPVTATITVTPTVNGCSGTASTYTITVNPTDNPNFNYSPSTFCQSGTDPSANITGGATGTFTASPAGLVFLNTSTGSIDVSASTINTYTVTFTTNGVCPSSSTTTINISTSPSATFSYSGPFCQGGANPLPTYPSGSSAGVYSASPSGLVFVNTNTGQVNLTTSTPGTYTVTNNIAASGGCAAASATNTITINPTPTVIVPANIVVCAGGIVPATNFVSTPAGGSFTWSNSNTSIGLGASGSGNILSFTATNTGSSPIVATITVIPTANTCTGTPSTYTITVNPNANATITPHNPLCANAGPITFTAAQSGGVWSGSGITNPSTGAFNPSLAGTGSIQIIYTISGLCGDADTTHIQINPLPVIVLGNDTTICNGQTLLLNAGNPGSTYSWTPGGSSSQTLMVSSAGLYIVQVTNTNTCTNVDSIQVAYSALANATITPVNPMCSNQPAFDLTAAQSGGVWSGTGITNVTSGTFSPQVAGGGVAQIIYTISGACGNADTITINVFPTETISIDTVAPACPDFNKGSITLHINGGTLPYLYNWSSGETTTTLTDLQVGTYSVTVTDSNQCVATRSVVFEMPIVDCFTPVLYIPNIFSPNGDGHNDVLYVHGRDIKILLFRVFDRWGEKVFETTDQTLGWDGTYKGKNAPEDVYAYEAKVTMDDGTEINRKGNISLVR